MYLDFIRYFLSAGNAHSIHSPFVFEFYNKIFKDKAISQDFSFIESKRTELLSNHTCIKRQDFGAGKRKNSEETISTLAKTSLKPKRWGQLLYKIIKFYNYKTVIDLGTSFGITTAYLANANPDVQVYTFEGCPETLKIAKNTFQSLDIQNINCIEGNIDETLMYTLKNLQQIDLVFFDANHKEEPTMLYFQACLKLKTDNSCFVFDDIYWSKEMKNAWKSIKSHPEVVLSIDLFFIGLVFFRKGLEKQHFVLK